MDRPLALQVLDMSSVLKSIWKLPEGIEFYEVDGKIVFPIRSKDDHGTTVTSDSIVYLIKRGDTKGYGWYKYGVLLSTIFDHHTQAFLDKLKSATVVAFNPDGGDLGLEG